MAASEINSRHLLSNVPQKCKFIELLPRVGLGYEPNSQPFTAGRDSFP